MKKRLETLISVYDDTVKKDMQNYNSIKKEHEKILKEIQLIENQCKIMKVEKKINKEYLDEWNMKIEEKEFEEERK